MARYQSVINAGGDIQEISRWINICQGRALAGRSRAPRHHSAGTPDLQGKSRPSWNASPASPPSSVMRGPADKAEIYRGINLTLTYQPEAGIVQAQARLSADSHGVMVGVRGGP